MGLFKWCADVSPTRRFADKLFHPETSVIYSVLNNKSNFSV